jgi:formylglycine-generating enzyme required for sulfatase activity
MKNKSALTVLAGALAMILEAASALGQAPVVASSGRNGELACTNLQPGTVASVEWAPELTGLWTNSWAGLDAVVVDSNGAIRVSVPMFYRVRGVAQTNNPAPAGMELIPAGAFTMGNCMDSTEGWFFELPLHTVQVSAFYMDKYEVTKALWDGVYQWATNHGYSFDSAGSGKASNHPVQNVTWYDMVKWCNARSEKEGRVPAYYTDPAQTNVYRSGRTNVSNGWVKWNVGYRLPTEAEWEKAARGGVSGHRFPWADADTIYWSRANYNASPLSATGGYAYDVNPTNGYHPTFAVGDVPYTSPVGYFAANGYGLYDLSGNVFEWCWDWWGVSYSSAAQADPRGPATGSGRVIRGGNSNSDAKNCRLALRYDYGPTDRNNLIGFRSVLPPGQP